MTTLFLALFLALAQPGDSLRVLFWNLENFFDWRNDSTSVSDAAFSSQGERHWTRKRFQTKCNAVAKGILWAGSQGGALPDAVGLAEVENAFVLRQLLRNTALRKLDYELLHFDSPDARGIDVALLYRRSRLQLLEARPVHLYAADGSRMATRDILLARFRTAEGGHIGLLVNHHPSKYGGAEASQGRRQVAVERLRTLADSLLALGEVRLLAMGDFNDTPDQPLFRRLDGCLVNCGLPLQAQGRGSIKYEGTWDLIDLFFASPACRAGAMQVLQLPFLMMPDAAHGGEKPRRTYSGPRYLGGVSDHCPVWIAIPD